MVSSVSMCSETGGIPIGLFQNPHISEKKNLQHFLSHKKNNHESKLKSAQFQRDSGKKTDSSKVGTTVIGYLAACMGLGFCQSLQKFWTKIWSISEWAQHN